MKNTEFWHIHFESRAYIYRQVLFFLFLFLFSMFNISHIMSHFQIIYMSSKFLLILCSIYF
ncbi:hypothetical protein FSP39_001844 [Pinctada imbricata]|uniref:Uncharacterized protein n=1 Tax=Pinctada imbricata TaxID=66713 RepID=A0AA88YT06_PINIB|nr:hypothetical protein FSP39_001844 [Pinctada imbricata]